jgi:hypothetical protein
MVWRADTGDWVGHAGGGQAADEHDGRAIDNGAADMGTTPSIMGQVCRSVTRTAG